MQTPRNLNNLPLASHPLFKAGDVDHARHTLSRLYTSINLEPCTKSKAFHFWTWHDIYDSNLEAVRKTYDGPLTLADDMTVWNVTDAQIVVREAITTEDVAPTSTPQAYRTAKREPHEVTLKWISEGINAGKWEGYTPSPMPKQ